MHNLGLLLLSVKGGNSRCHRRVQRPDEPVKVNMASVLMSAFPHICTRDALQMQHVRRALVLISLTCL